jgi:hypothetical protein
MARWKSGPEWPLELAEFREADWLAVPPTGEEARVFGDEAYWQACPDMADRLRWSLATSRWGDARLAWADANLGVQAWSAVLAETLSTPLWTRRAY